MIDLITNKSSINGNKIRKEKSVKTDRFIDYLRNGIKWLTLNVIPC